MHKFKIGDRVKVKDPEGAYPLLTKLTIFKLGVLHDLPVYRLRDEHGMDKYLMHEHHLELAG